MTKRNTIGKPTKSRDADSRTRRLSKAERDRRNQRNLLYIVGIVTALIVTGILIALAYDYLYVPQQEVSTVNGVEIKTSDYRERVRAERWRLANEVRQIYNLTGSTNNSYAQQVLNQLSDPITVGSTVLEEMELEVLLKEEAKARGIVVDEAAVQARVDEYMQQFTGLSLTPTPTLTNTPELVPSVTPLISATASLTATSSPIPSETPLPTVSDCTEGDCATVTPLPSATITPTATATSDATATATNTPLAEKDVKATVERFESNFYTDGDDDGKASRDVLRDIFYMDALRQALREAITDEMIANGEIKTQQIAANTRHILIAAPSDTTVFDAAKCESEEWASYRQQALDAIELLNNGEPFATLAEAISDDTGSAIEGGNLGEVADIEGSNYVEPFKQAIIDGNVGEFIGPVCTQFGFHIIQILEKESRDISENDLETSRSNSYSTWESQLQANASIQRRDDWIERVPSGPSLNSLLGDIIQ